MTSQVHCGKEDIEKWLEPILKRLDLEEYTVNLSGTSEKGDGYLGDINFVTVAGKKASEIKTYKFVIKCGKKSTKLREVMPIREAFENEIFIYSKFLPAIKKFQEERKIKEPFNSVAKCYDTFVFEDMEVIVLEDLKASNYALWDRKKPMDRKHVKEILRSYGKLHAISFALKDQQPEVFKRLSSSPVDVFRKFKVDDSKDDSLKDILRIARGRGDKEIEEIAIALKNCKRITDLPYPQDSYTVIVHGDCWNNNFMFKYEDEDKRKLAKVCFLDWQLSRLVSPVFDLSYFLFTCMSYDDVQYFDEYNQIYYESLSSFLRELGSDPDILFPYEELLRQWKKYATFGLRLMPKLITLCLLEKNDVTDLAEAVESGSSFSEAFDYSIKNTSEYEKRTFAVLKLAREKQFI